MVKKFKLNRNADSRKHLIRKLAVSLIFHDRIRTTMAKCKFLQPFADKLMTLAKRNTEESRRIACEMLPNQESMEKLFGPMRQQYASRSDGFTRIWPVQFRRYDSSKMGIIEFVDSKNDMKQAFDAMVAQTESKKLSNGFVDEDDMPIEMKK